MSRRTVLAAAVLAGLGAASMGGAEIVTRPPRDPDPSPPVPRFQRPRKSKGPRSNEKRKPSLRERKKHKAKIAYASRRANH